MSTTSNSGNSKPKKKVAKKSAAKKAAKKVVAKPAAKRNRKSTPLYAKVTLGKLKDLLGESNDDAEVVVSRNFVMDIKKKQLEAQAAKDLGI